MPRTAIWPTAQTGAAKAWKPCAAMVDASQAAQSLFAAMQGQGWQLRLSLRKGDRAVYVYEKGATLAVLTFRRQTVMTILEIWSGNRRRTARA